MSTPAPKTPEDSPHEQDSNHNTVPASSDSSGVLPFSGLALAHAVHLVSTMMVAEGLVDCIRNNRPEEALKLLDEHTRYGGAQFLRLCQYYGTTHADAFTSIANLLQKGQENGQQS